MNRNIESNGLTIALPSTGLHLAFRGVRLTGQMNRIGSLRSAVQYQNSILVLSPSRTSGKGAQARPPARSGVPGPRAKAWGVRGGEAPRNEIDSIVRALRQ